MAVKSRECSKIVTCKAHKPCQWKASSPPRVVCAHIFIWDTLPYVNPETLEFAYCDAHCHYVLLTYTDVLLTYNDVIKSYRLQAKRRKEKSKSRVFGIFNTFFSDID